LGHQRSVRHAVEFLFLFRGHRRRRASHKTHLHLFPAQLPLLPPPSYICGRQYCKHHYGDAEAQRRLDRGHDITENVLVLAPLRSCTGRGVVGTVGAGRAGWAAWAVAKCRALGGSVELYLALLAAEEANCESAGDGD
jgi:hypothetical protein